MYTTFKLTAETASANLVSRKVVSHLDLHLFGRRIAALPRKVRATIAAFVLLVAFFSDPTTMHPLGWVLLIAWAIGFALIKPIESIGDPDKPS